MSESDWENEKEEEWAETPLEDSTDVELPTNSQSKIIESSEVDSSFGSAFLKEILTEETFESNYIRAESIEDIFASGLAYFLEVDEKTAMSIGKIIDDFINAPVKERLDIGTILSLLKQCGFSQEEFDGSIGSLF